MIKPAKKEVWNWNIDDKIYIEVVHWGVHREHDFEPMNNGHGVWNYYCTIFERVMPNKFDALWLPEEIKRFSEKGNEYVIFNYMEQPFANVDWHGGITSYEKLGQIKGHRGVKLGCDYSHIWDEDRGYNYTFDEVAQEAQQTAEQLIALYEMGKSV